MSSSTNNTIINPKDCSYQCGVRIYWNVSENAYFEVFTKKHFCPNRITNNTNNNTGSSVNRQFYSKKPGSRSKKCQIPLNCCKDQYKISKRNMRYYQILL